MTIRAELLAEIAKGDGTATEIARRTGRTLKQVAAHLKLAYDDELVGRRPTSSTQSHAGSAWVYYAIAARPGYRPWHAPERDPESVALTRKGPPRRINTRRLPMERAQE